jgi:hypothetical protein
VSAVAIRRRAVLGGGTGLGGGENRVGEGVGGGGQRFGEVGGVFEHAEPGVVRVADLRLLLGVAESSEHELAKISEGAGFFDGDAVLR